VIAPENIMKQTTFISDTYVIRYFNLAKYL